MQLMQKWNSNVQASPKCTNYRIFKIHFRIKFYITELQPYPLSLYLDSEQQITDFLWNGVDGKMLNVHEDSAIFVREISWATSFTICMNENTSQKKERNVYRNSIYGM